MNSSNSFLRKVACQDFESQFTNLITSKFNFFAYFHGDHNENGQSWCDDCDVAQPVVNESIKVLEGQDKVLFVEFPIPRADWRNSKFLFRVHPKAKLERVPTLIYYENGVEFGRLTEGELFDKANVQEFVKQALE